MYTNWKECKIKNKINKCITNNNKYNIIMYNKKLINNHYYYHIRYVIWYIYKIKYNYTKYNKHK